MSETPDRVIEERADWVVSDLNSDGGRLDTKTLDAFIQKIYAEPTIFQQASKHTMKSSEEKIPDIGFTGQILHPSPGDNTALASGKRAKPTTGQITLTPAEYIAEVWLPKTVLEDNIEGEQLRQTVLAEMAGRIGVDLAGVAYYGDTTLGTATDLDALRSTQDGWFKKADANVLNCGGASVDDDLLTDFYLTMPPQYRRTKKRGLKFYMHDQTAVDWKRQNAKVATVAGDAARLTEVMPSFFGKPVESDEVLEVDGSTGYTKMLFTDPANLIVAIWRDLTIEADYEPRIRSIYTVVTMRVCFSFYRKDAIAVATNVKPKAA